MGRSVTIGGKKGGRPAVRMHLCIAACPLSGIDRGWLRWFEPQSGRLVRSAPGDVKGDVD